MICKVTRLFFEGKQDVVKDFTSSCMDFTRKAAQTVGEIQCIMIVIWWVVVIKHCIILRAIWIWINQTNIILIISVKDNICNVINFSSQCVCTRRVYGYVSFHLFHWLQFILRKNVDHYYGFNTCNPNSFNQNTCRAMQFYSKYVYSTLSKKCFRFYQSAILSPDAL